MFKNLALTVMAILNFSQMSVQNTFGEEGALLSVGHQEDKLVLETSQMWN